MINSDKSPTYNPAPQVLDEAIINEWPGQQVGLFLSIGTGKRPGGTSNHQSEWWEGFAGGLGSFAEAKRKLIAKIEGCEKTHREMMSDHLPKRGVNSESYLRLNVEVGVGEFGMNEWNRLADISNSTQSYLNTPAVKVMLDNGAREMAKVEAQRRKNIEKIQRANNSYDTTTPTVYPPSPHSQAIELPCEEAPAIIPRPLSRPGPLFPGPTSHNYASGASPDDKYMVLSSDEYPQPTDTQSPRTSEDQHYKGSGEYRRPEVSPNHIEAPPLPPKRPVSFDIRSRPPQSNNTVGQPAPRPLPYPDTDGPPPVVNMARKPEFVPR